MTATPTGDVPASVAVKSTDLHEAFGNVVIEPGGSESSRLAEEAPPGPAPRWHILGRYVGARRSACIVGKHVAGRVGRGGVAAGDGALGGARVLLMCQAYATGSSVPW